MPVQLIIPKRHGDHRGWFSETYRADLLKNLGIDDVFIQDNQSFSAQKGTLRGLHFQTPNRGQAKLIRVLKGAIFDVAVDVRAGSPTYGQSVSAILTAEKGEQLYIPIGFAHGFMTLEDDCEVAYKVNETYAPQNDGGILWNSAGIAWPLDVTPVLSAKDEVLPTLSAFNSPFIYDGRPLKPL